jgi:hypothetical protein
MQYPSLAQATPVASSEPSSCVKVGLRRTYEQTDCPMCFDVMSPADLDHPIQCPRECGYNFCVGCIEGLIKSSKDDYMEASDGNYHVKVFLKCPQCRSNLVSTIRDTLILRKVDILNGRVESNARLTTSELRLRTVLYDEEVQHALAEARSMEDVFFGRSRDHEENSSNIKDGPNERNSFHTGSYEEDDIKGRMHVDPTLFNGLEYAMTAMEKLIVTQFMTSGDISKLANAAEILQGIATRVVTGISKPQSAFSKPQNSSIYNLIEESKTAKRRALASPRCSSTKNQNKWDGIKIRNAQYKSFKEEDRFLKLSPLPARMPKFVEINVRDDNFTQSFLPLCMPVGFSFPLEFCDETWDGRSVVDAFSDLSITTSVDTAPVVNQKKPMTTVVFDLLDQVGHGFTDSMDTEHHRVLVSSVNSIAGRQGVMKGDVITHINGKEFKGTSQDLEEQIQASVDKNGSFTLVLNADRSVAEALKKRAPERLLLLNRRCFLFL